MRNIGELAALLTIIWMLAGWVYQTARQTSILMMLTRDGVTQSAEIPASGSHRATRVSLTSYEPSVAGQ
jgi:hypothetical protein